MEKGRNEEKKLKNRRIEKRRMLLRRKV